MVAGSCNVGAVIVWCAAAPALMRRSLQRQHLSALLLLCSLAQFRQSIVPPAASCPAVHTRRQVVGRGARSRRNCRSVGRLAARGEQPEELVGREELRLESRRALSRCIVAAGIGVQSPVWCAADSVGSSVNAGSIAPDPVFVVDESNLLTPSSEKYLTRLLSRLEADTQAKLRVLCPPIGVKEDRKAWKQFSSPVFKQMLVDQGSLVILAEQLVGAENRDINLLSFLPGSKLLSRWQFRFTKYSFQREKAKFGTPDYVNSRGTDAAIRGTARSLAASIYKLIDDPSYGGFILPDSEVDDILGRHGE